MPPLPQVDGKVLTYSIFTRCCKHAGFYRIRWASTEIGGFQVWITFSKSICVTGSPRKLLMLAAVSLEHHQRVAGHFVEVAAADLQFWVCTDTHLSSPCISSLDPQEKLAFWKSKHYLLSLSSWTTAQKIGTEICIRRVFIVAPVWQHASLLRFRGRLLTLLIQLQEQLLFSDLLSSRANALK